MDEVPEVCGRTVSKTGRRVRQDGESSRLRGRSTLDGPSPLPTPHSLNLLSSSRESDLPWHPTDTGGPRSSLFTNRSVVTGPATRTNVTGVVGRTRSEGLVRGDARLQQEGTVSK